jgi:Putative transposase
VGIEPLNCGSVSSGPRSLTWHMLVLFLPCVWSVFRQNRHLLRDLPALGAAAIQALVKAKHGVRVLLMVVQHTFGRHLNFHPHLHVLVSAGGMQESEGRWVAHLELNKGELMEMWRYAVIAYLWRALYAKVLTSGVGSDRLKVMLKAQHERPWNIHIDRFKSKQQFLRYAGRYIRRPPIDQSRFVKVTNEEVSFRTKDLRQKRVVITRYSTEQFVDLLAEHVRERYQHAMRYFGLLAPGSKRKTSAAMFAALEQKKRSPPKRLSWRISLIRDFRRDPLVDSQGQPMRWLRRVKPLAR